MTTEFDLSNWITEIPERKAFFIRDIGVKEFIRLLLDTYEGMDENWIQKSTIIKYAGDKLVEQPKGEKER